MYASTRCAGDTHADAIEDASPGVGGEEEEEEAFRDAIVVPNLLRETKTEEQRESGDEREVEEAIEEQQSGKQ